MENTWLEPMLIVQSVVGLVAGITGIFLLLKAFSFQMSYVFGMLMCLLSTALLTMVGLMIPLLVNSGETILQSHLTADVLMYGTATLIVVAILAFIIDHVTEFPAILTVAAAACFSIAIFPWIYWSQQGQLNDRFSIVITQPQPKGNETAKELIQELNVSARTEKEKDKTNGDLNDYLLGAAPQVSQLGGSSQTPDTRRATRPPLAAHPSKTPTGRLKPNT